MDDTEKKVIKTIRVLIVVFIVFILTGTGFAASSPDNGFLGIAIMLVGAVIGVFSAIYSMKLTAMRKERQDDRIKRLEEEVEALKKNQRG